ncbi:lysylphosphatidylglycerol synthase transmembrane domain-containing protein [Oceanitalea stevensii]|uniref:Flippase-like domain-containing protein n=1 Tax=Oceanitalea stevensii TaxID=2763072 RepID=A0ABR8Z1B0_9MICO|nr:lysylphosphatidylglycerol synthase transmembrane domain-containing protein [Oceanitalea stevensii]MBD8062095.1 flippase-like domain-containing protein [Oceanitalea stevensii]
MTDRPGERTPVADSPTRGAPRRKVLLVDVPESRVHRPRDLLELVLSVLGIGMVLLLAVYAHATAIGVTEDVQSAAALVLREILLLPVTVLEGVVTFFLPLFVVVMQLVRRRWRAVAEAIAAAVVAWGVTTGAVLLLDTYGPTALSVGLTITSEGDAVIAMNPLVAALAALLTTVGTRAHRPTVRWSWNLLWVVLVLTVIRGALTLPGAVVTVLIGRAIGLAGRYIVGVYNERAEGIALVQGLRHAGVDPTRVVRLDSAGEDVQAWTVTTSAPVGYTARPVEPLDTTAVPSWPGSSGRPADSIVPDVLTDPHAVVAASTSPDGVTLDPVGAHRVYSVWDAEGRRWYVTVLDGDRQVVGYLSSLWARLRVRGLHRRRATTLRDAADRAALLAYATERAGVRTAPLTGMAESRDSVLMVTAHIGGARRLSDIPAEEVGDELLDELWRQLGTAHAAGIAHLDLSADAVLVTTGSEVLLLDWENGEIAASELSRRLDLAQLLAATAAHVGEDRALASAARSLDSEELASVAPLLQPVVLTAHTRAAAERPRELLNSLRARLVDQNPAADVEPMRLARFSMRTVVMVTIAVVAVWLLLGTLNFEQVVAATRNANPWWLLATFAFGVLTFLGSAMGLVAFAPEKLGLWRTTLVQVAAGVVSLVAPAGVGPAALNLRFLNRQRVATPLAVATVALVQVSQFVTTVMLLATMALVTGSAGTLSVPSGAVNAVAITAVLIVVVVLVVSPVRTWLWEKLGPTLRQVWPRVLWVVGSPSRLLVGLSGNVIMTLGYVAAFGCALAAFGYTLPLTTLSITYLTSNTVGAAVPSPGGIGPVEAALTGGLTVAGIPAGVAFSVALVFRLLTFWIRVPLGWAALRHLQRRGAV